jgi:hypothetical protein
MDKAMIFGLGASLAALLFILELVRQRKLREEYSLLWLLTAIVLLILSISRPLLDMLAESVGIYYPPSALFLVALTFVMFILLHFSTVLTRLTQENKEIAQQVALLRYELEQACQNQPQPSADECDSDDQNGDQPGAVE